MLSQSSKQSHKIQKIIYVPRKTQDLTKDSYSPTFNNVTK